MQIKRLTVASVIKIALFFVLFFQFRLKKKENANLYILSIFELST